MESHLAVEPECLWSETKEDTQVCHKFILTNQIRWLDLHNLAVLLTEPAATVSFVCLFFGLL